MKKLILAITIAITFALTILSVLPNKIYASEISDKYVDLVYSKNLINENGGHYEFSTYYDITAIDFELEKGSYTLSFNAICNDAYLRYEICSTEPYEIGITNQQYIVSGLNTITFDVEFKRNIFIRLWSNGFSSCDINNIMLNIGSTALPYEPFINGSMIYNDAYNQALIDNMYWLNEINTTIVDIKELGSNYSAKENNFSIMPIEYKTGLYGSANFNNLVYDFASYIADYENIFEQKLEIELLFESPILLNNEIRFTTNDITGFTFISESKNEYNYDFVYTSEGAKDYLHDFTNLNEPYSFMNKPIKGMKIRFIERDYPSFASPSISFVANLFNEGYSQGYDEGNANGYNSGFNGGYSQGYDEGYQGGYNEGVQNGDLKSTGLQQMFLTILGFPIQALQGVFNFEIFGINLLSLITFILTIGIVVFVIKKFI